MNKVTSRACSWIYTVHYVTASCFLSPAFIFQEVCSFFDGFYGVLCVFMPI